jgi:hypothetical protein
MNYISLKYARLKTNTLKLMINSFANGHIDLVKEFHRKYGDELFEFVPSIGHRGNHERLIFYAFKGNHESVIEFYLKSGAAKPLSNREIYQIGKNAAKLKNFKNFINNRLPIYQEFLPLEKVIEEIRSNITQSYNLELIDEYLNEYPEDFKYIVNKCSTSPKGKQLRRHLQLKELISE